MGFVFHLKIVQQFNGNSALCPMLLSLLGTEILQEEAVHGKGAGILLLSHVMLCYTKMTAKGIQATVLREYSELEYC